MGGLSKFKDAAATAKSAATWESTVSPAMAVRRKAFRWTYRGRALDLDAGILRP